ncbi:ABC transporter permease [Gordonia sp. VNK21]|uniref:ABC transporter permease n=1 Tax=Gordonia sp. VNK21 TaxID=3382483 RepID=UPI0038D46D4E
MSAAIPPLPTGPADPSGAAPGFDPRRTLRLRTECARQFGRRGTLVLLIVMLVLPLAMAAAMKAGRSDMVFEGDVLGRLATDSAENFTMVCLFVGAQLFLVVVVAYLFGDALTRESNWGYLRVLATVPVPRTRLLLIKAAALSVLVTAGVLVYAVASYLIGLVFFGPGPLSPVAGEGVTGAAGLGRLAIMVAFILVYLTWIAALALLLSTVSHDNTAVAITGTVMITIGFHVLGGLGMLGRLRAVLPSRNYAAWLDAARVEFDPTNMLWGVFLSLLYATALTAAAVVAINVREIRR